MTHGALSSIQTQIISEFNYYLLDNYTHIYTLALTVPENRSSYIQTFFIESMLMQLEEVYSTLPHPILQMMKTEIWQNVCPKLTQLVNDRSGHSIQASLHLVPCSFFNHILVHPVFKLGGSKHNLYFP